jgi:S-adenosylmethionine synthetase
MHKTSEWVSLGHPDKVADYISSYLLDRHLERDPNTRFAVETMIKNNVVTLGGEVTSKAGFSDDELAQMVRDAVNAIGYTKEYQDKWGEEHTICGDELEVRTLIGRQSSDIDQGVRKSGWGDQGIFFGLAVNSPASSYMPRDHFLAGKLGQAVFESGLGGLDIKTLVSTHNGRAVEVVVAVPLPENNWGDVMVRDLAENITGCQQIILNGTGRYITHSSIADCGVTGRKLAVDFYGGNCRIGGGSPWGKDATKADVTLNIHARQLALDFLRKSKRHTVGCAISCSIGSSEIRIVYFDGAGRELRHEQATAHPADLIARYGLNRPVFAGLCREGLFSNPA